MKYILAAVLGFSACTIGPTYSDKHIQETAEMCVKFWHNEGNEGPMSYNGAQKCCKPVTTKHRPQYRHLCMRLIADMSGLP